MRLIDADKLTKAIDDFFEGICVYDVSPNEAIEDFQNIVNNIETIESRPKGKWIYTHGDYFKVRCGVCGFENQCEDNFCPKCGADMRGDDHEQLRMFKAK